MKATSTILQLKCYRMDIVPSNLPQKLFGLTDCKKNNSTETQTHA